MALPRCDTWPHAVKTPIRLVFCGRSLGRASLGVTNVRAVQSAGIVSPQDWFWQGTNYRWWVSTTWCKRFAGVIPYIDVARPWVAVNW